jgi:AraC-like DNA-binding protein
VTGLWASTVASGDALHAYSILHTSDLDEARDRVTRVCSPHSLRVAGSEHRLDTLMSHAPLGAVSINRLRYGATVDIDVGCTEHFVLVMMPLTGFSEVRCGGESLCSTPQRSSVISPTLPLRISSRYDADQIMVRIDRGLIERYCTQYLGHELRRPVEFQLTMDVGAGGGESWCRLIRLLVSELDRPTNAFTSALTRVHVEHLVVSTLLVAQPNLYRDELTQPARPITPAYIRRVEEYIDAHAERPLTVSDLAAHVGVSRSTLFAGFRAYRKTSPIAYLKGVRMKRAREELAAASAGSVTVTDVTMRWGFAHLGRFAADYKRWFGESPSETLRH